MQAPSSSDKTTLQDIQIFVYIFEGRLASKLMIACSGIKMLIGKSMLGLGPGKAMVDSCRSTKLFYVRIIWPKLSIDRYN